MTTTPKTTLDARDLGRLMHAMRREIALMFRDGSIPPAWENCTEEMKASSERSALAMLVSPEMTAGEEHDRWWHEKELQGWQYGPVRDNERKLHPSMRPFCDLPLGEQLKDLARIAMVRELRRLVDLSGLVR